MIGYPEHARRIRIPGGTEDERRDTPGDGLPADRAGRRRHRARAEQQIFGLRVANLDGSRVTPRAAVVRNVLRIVDLTLALFPLVMVFFSPLRQRLGDVAAGTLVVRSGVTIPPPPARGATDESADG